MSIAPAPGLDDLDRRLVLVTQAGLPLCPRPYEAVAAELSVTPDEVMQRLRRLQDQGDAEVAISYQPSAFSGQPRAVWMPADAADR